MKLFKKQAFTLVELIVVITILAILGTIAFISLQGYTREARDSKRLSDINNIQKKIGIEIVKGTNLTSLINLVKTNSGLTINSASGTSIQGTANFQALKEDGDKFKDPITGGDYVLSYSVGGTGTGAYKFIQLATINEEKNEAVVKGNYYQMKSGDSIGIIKNGANNFVVNEGSNLPYEPVAGGGGGGPVAVNGVCGSDNGGSFTSNPTNLCSAGTSSSITDNGGGNTYTWTCDGINGGTQDVCSANNTNLSQYPGCNETDITIGSYTISSCNVGATTASTDWTVSRGQYFQWGRNKGFSYGDTTQQATTIDGSIGLNAGTDIYGFVWSGSLPNPFIWANTDITNNWGNTTNTSVARQGPCATGYHVPSNAEWAGIVTTGGWGTAQGTAMQTALKLPYAGYRNFSNGAFSNGASSSGIYWSSTPAGTNGYRLYFESSHINPTDNNARAYGLSVRCFKN